MPRGPSAVVQDDYLMNTAKVWIEFWQTKSSSHFAKSYTDCRELCWWQLWVDMFRTWYIQCAQVLYILLHVIFSIHVAHVQNLNVWVSAWFHLQVCIPVSKLTLNSSRLHRFDRFKPWNMSIWVKCDPEWFNLLTCLDKVPGTSNIRPLKSRGLQKNYPSDLGSPPRPSERAWRVMKPLMRWDSL